MSGLRFWRNTPNVSKTAPGATTTLTWNILGYEWDASPDSGFAPPGLIDLSSTTLSVNTFLLDYGSTTGNGTATHNLTLYRDPVSGALVFGAGTVFWSWGLSAEHDGLPTPTDPDIQQAMVNLLADIGVQPGSLQSGLVGARSSPPTARLRVFGLDARQRLKLRGRPTGPDQRGRERRRWAGRRCGGVSGRGDLVQGVPATGL